MSAQEAFPGELAIVPYRGGWKLLIHGPDLSGEVTSPDRGRLDQLASAYAQYRQGHGPLLPASQFTRLYFPHGEKAHLDHPAAPGIFCDPDADTDSMFGTGRQEEREWAAALPLCADCRRWSRAMRTVR